MEVKIVVLTPYLFIKQVILFTVLNPDLVHRVRESKLSVKVRCVLFVRYYFSYPEASLSGPKFRTETLSVRDGKPLQ